MIVKHDIYNEYNILYNICVIYNLYKTITGVVLKDI